MSEDRERRMSRQICALRESLLDLLNMVDRRSAVCTDIPMSNSDRLYWQAAAAEHREFKIARARSTIKDGREYDSDWNEAINEAVRIIGEDNYGRMVVHKLHHLKRQSD